MLLLWSTTVSSIGGLILGLLILTRAKKEAGNIFFALVSILISLVIIANYFSLANKGSEDTTLFWIRAVMFLVPYLIVAMFYFCSSYLNPGYKTSLKKILLLVTPTVVLSLINLTSLVYKSVEISSNGNIIPVTGPAIALNGLHIMPLFILSIWNMAKNSKRKDLSNKEKFMIRFSLYLLLFSFGLQIVTSFVVVTVFHYTTLVPLGNFLSFIFIILMTVSIFYFQAFNLNLIGAFFFAAILIVLMFAEIFTATGIQTIIYKIIVFVLVSIVGLEFINSVKKEIKQKEDLQVLSKKLDEANRHLEDLDEQKDNFISMASHELNTPIAAIEGYLSMIIDEKMAGDVNPKVKAYLENIYFSSKRLAALVRDLLNVSRIESGRVHLINEEASIEDVIEKSIAEVKIKADEVGHKLTFEKPKTPLPKTWFDVSRITEVMINIIGNAIKYTDPPGKIAVSAHADDGKLVVAIQDNGRGIPKGKEEAIFEKFVQVEVLKDQVKGTGLGMFITKNLIELHKGKLWFKSSTDKADHGTTFYFSLPIYKTKPLDPHEGEGALFQKKPSDVSAPVTSPTRPPIPTTTFDNPSSPIPEPTKTDEPKK